VRLHYGWKDPLLAAAYRFGVELGRRTLQGGQPIEEAERLIALVFCRACVGTADDRMALLDDIRAELTQEG
jgi:hypothetical protein